MFDFLEWQFLEQLSEEICGLILNGQRRVPVKRAIGSIAAEPLRRMRIDACNLRDVLQ